MYPHHMLMTSQIVFPFLKMMVFRLRPDTTIQSHLNTPLQSHITRVWLPQHLRTVRLLVNTTIQANTPRTNLL